MSHWVAFLMARPVAFEKGVIGGGLVFAQGAQDGAGLGIDGGEVDELAAEMNGAVGLEGQAEIDLLARETFQVREEPGDGMGVLPDVAAGALTAADAFPAVEAAIGKAVAGRGGEDGRIEESAVQEPVGEGRIVPGVVPETGLGTQAGEMVADVLGHSQGGIEARGIVSAWRQPVELEVGHVPGQDEGGFGRGAGGELHLARERADKLLAEGLEGRGRSGIRGSRVLLLRTGLARGRDLGGAEVAGLGVQKGQAEGAEIRLLGQWTEGLARLVAQDDVIHANVAPGA